VPERGAWCLCKKYLSCVKICNSCQKTVYKSFYYKERSVTVGVNSLILNESP